MIYGDLDLRGRCPAEDLEQVTFFSRLRRGFPDTFGALGVHPRNEGQLRSGQFSAVSKHKAEGMVKGASDIIIPGAPTFICEMKRRDHTKSAWQDGQVQYLNAAAACGCFTVLALGADAAWAAFEEWRRGR